MEEEGKGFVIKDRRSFDEQGELRDEKQEVGQKEGEVKQEEEMKEEPKGEESQKRPLPEVNFSSLIMSLSSSALLHFGEIADPETGAKKKDLDIARQSIDVISMLKEKTKGNLTDEEQKFIDSMLADLRWRFVKAKE